MADRYRQRRFALLRSLIGTLPEPGPEHPLKILDVGGTSSFWERMGFAGNADVEIVLLNLYDQEVANEHMRSVVGDAADMSMFPSRSFDVVVSNSVIEHLPTLELQHRMASEVLRVGRRHWVQTPNRRFPLEPHFLFPLFQYLPVSVRAWLLGHMDLGWYKREKDPGAARSAVLSVRLMKGSELRSAFPESRLVTERAFGLVKSFIAIGGWGKAGASLRDADGRPLDRL